MDFLIHPSETSRLVGIKLPSPKEGEPERPYLVDQINFKVFEIVRYSDQFRSWFADNSLSKDGSLSMITQIDRLFIMLPFLLKAKEQFRTLHDIVNSTEYFEDLTLVLSPDTNWEVISDTREVDGELYIRYNQDKVLEWLENKKTKIIEILRKEEMEPTASIATIRSYAKDLLADYLPTEISDIFKANSKESALESALDVETKASLDVSRKTSKKRSNSKEPVKNCDNKLTKWFSPITRS